VNLGWRWGFALRSAEFPLLLAFVIVYRDPSKHPRLSAEEREYIRAAALRPKARPKAARSPCSAISCAIGKYGG